jgi:uncharacterized membrane protein (UPF0127 family)
MKLLHLLLSLCLLFPAGCKQTAPPAPASNLPTVGMTIGSKTYTLEIAAKTADRNRGLMYRDSMPADHGMIFAFAEPEEQSFWMKNTRIPLDILFLDPGGKIVSIQRMEPYVERGTKSKGAAQFAVELNGGEAKTTGVKEGDVVRIPDEVRNAGAD